jgi:hypothetical protein
MDDESGGMSKEVSNEVGKGVSKGVSECVSECVSNTDTSHNLYPSTSVNKLRHNITSEGVTIELRKHVLRGAYCCLESSEGVREWRVPSFKLLVFVSSTFTDTQLERNYLMDELLLKVREEGRRNGECVSVSE